jgi:UDP-glucose 4-epimerase
MRPEPGEPAVWVTETLAPRPKNIYGVTKLAAENLCELFHRNQGLNVIVLRTSRFFPEQDDDAARRAAFEGANNKANEYLNRRADLSDMVSAHLAAAERARAIGFGRYIVSATPPFAREDAAGLGRDAGAVIERRVPGTRAAFEALGWRMPQTLDRVYDNSAARRDLGWQPAYDFARIVKLAQAGEPFVSELARAVGRKRYHDQSFEGEQGPYPVEET